MPRTARSAVVVYIPTRERLSERDSLTSADRWEIVRDCLWDEGFTDIRPAPPASLAYVPRALRRG